MSDRYIEYRRLSEIRRAARNPKGHQADLIATSIDRFGFVSPIELDERTGRLVGGHGRLDDLEAKQQAGAELPDGIQQADDGEWLAPMVRGWASEDDTEAEAYLVATNETTIAGGWDRPELAALLGGLRETRREAFEATGYDDDRLDVMLGELAASRMADSPIIGDPDEAPPVPDKPITETGDLWLLDQHRLYCGDSAVNGVAVATSGDLVDMVWTDPPYGVEYVGKTKDALTIENDERDLPGLQLLLAGVLGSCKNQMRAGATIFVAAPPGPHVAVFVSALSDLGLWKQLIVWVKDQFVFGRSDYHYRHEQVFYGWKEGAAHHPVPDRTSDTVWEIPRPKRSTEHPTMKPVELVARAIRNHTDPGQTVLDPFAGSGTTLIAAHQEGRLARLVELDPAYCDVICRRFEQATGIAPVRDGVEVSFIHNST